MRSAQVQAEIFSGMFTSERVARVQTVDGPVSFFVDQSRVQGATVCAEILESDERHVLLRFCTADGLETFKVPRARVTETG